jgi:hypothetical protein
VRAATGGFVLECEADDDGRLRLILAVPGARRHDVARAALRDTTDIAREADVVSLELMLLDPDDATIEQKHRLELDVAEPEARVA